MGEVVGAEARVGREGPCERRLELTCHRSTQRDIDLQELDLGLGPP